ncbi:MAG: ROK family protein [Sphaerochaetaceae bacterium]|nr:ROK family protein [Spirochaetales bacterium]MDY5500101.1 ROK family protein [Sphaerochaetaceae bacterium]
MTCFGLDIGGTKSSAVLGELDWERGTYYRVDRVEIPMEGDSWQSVLDRLAASCRTMAFFHQDLTPCAVGISCGGPLDGGKGIIYSPPNLPGWDDVPIVDYVSSSLDIPAFLENDANACALAEWRFGGGIGCNNLIFLTFGTGLGAGLILDGRLYSGTNGLAGEVGHIRLEDDGPLGYGKHGSFEGFCSGGGIARLARALLSKPHAPSALDAYSVLTAKVVAQEAFHGDSLALTVYRISARELGKGLSLLMDILNPQRIIIGSIFSRCESLFREEMERVIAEEALPSARAVCKIVPSGLGERLGDVAALSVAAQGMLLAEG